MAHGAFPMNLPTAGSSAATLDEILAPQAAPAEEMPAAEDPIEAVLENQAHEARVLLSRDALAAIIEAAAGDHAGAQHMLAELVDAAKLAYPREDGWIILNRARLNALSAPAPEAEPIRSHADEITSQFLAASAQAQAAPSLGYGADLARWILQGDAAKVFTAVRELDERGQSPAETLTETITALDASRAQVPAETLDRVIEALAGALGAQAGNEAVATRLAIVRAIDAARN
jgi:hypothetical protein